MATSGEAWQVESCGVDWITCSASSVRAAQELWWAADAISAAEQAEGRKVTGWGMKGLRGWSCGSIAWGARDGLVVARAGGKRAQESWLRLSTIAENVSRLDLQLTARSDRPMVHLSREAYENAQNWQGRGGKKLSTSLIVNSSGGSTCYVGSRSSDRVGRLYDKGVQEESDAAGIRWRWELEIKNRPALSIAKRLCQQQEPNELAGRWVAGWFRERQVFTPDNLGYRSITFDGGQETDDERKLAYLRKCIRPMVQKLASAGLLGETIEALGLAGDVPAVTTTGDNSPSLRGKTWHRPEISFAQQ